MAAILPRALVINAQEKAIDLVETDSLGQSSSWSYWQFTTNTAVVAYRMIDSQGSMAGSMGYIDGQVGKSIVIIQTAPWGPDLGSYWLMIGICGENPDACSWYIRDPARSTTFYTLTQNNVTIGVTKIPIQWVTVVQD
jgi:hypothetical protein